MKSVVFSVILIIGGIGCLSDSESVVSGIFAILVGIIILLVKYRVFGPRNGNRGRDTALHQPSAVQNIEHSEYLRQRERYETVERKWKNLVDRHYKLIEEIGVAYAVANNLSLPNSPEMEHVVDLCKQDIELAEGFKQYWKEHTQAMAQSGYCSSGDMSNVLPGFPAFKRLAIIYEKQKRYDEAITVCQHAIDLGFSNDGTDGQMPGRIARLMRKKGKEAKKLSEAEQIIIEE